MTRVVDLPDGWSHDPYLLAELGDRPVLADWTAPGALLVALSSRRRGTGLHGLGDPTAVAGLLRAHADEVSALAPDYVTAARGTWEVAGAPVAGFVAQGSDWDWWHADAPLDASTEGVVRLGTGPRDVALVADCLARAHPTASTAADDPALTGWWAVPEGDHLLGVVGAIELGPGLPPHLVSLGVDPAARGRGLAARLLAAAVRDGLAVTPELGPPRVSLGMYADNETARRVYERLGWTLAHRFTTRSRLAQVAVVPHG